MREVMGTEANVEGLCDQHIAGRDEYKKNRRHKRPVIGNIMSKVRGVPRTDA
jgi:hypothetical protein